MLRKDIQALRTIAVLLVVVFHLWPNRVPGGFVGVDVFFVISGFLITSHILKDVEKNRFNAFWFWSRRIRRLLPASFTVLAATLIMILIFVPFNNWPQWTSEIQAATFYFQNWVLAANSVDYLALANSPSPVQHFWSLSVEEQFYVAWPLLVIVATLLTATKRISMRLQWIFISIALATAASFAYGIYLTFNEPAIAYFSTPVRAWEFGAGSLLAFVPALKKNRTKNAAAVIGLTLIFVSGFSFDTQVAFPGFAALAPVIGTALVIAANLQSGLLFRIGAFWPTQWVGKHSYSIYLWHWPLIVLLPFVIGAELGTAQKVIAIAATFILSWLTTKFIEQPLMSGGRWPSLGPVPIFAAALVISTAIAVASGAAGSLAKTEIDNGLKEAAVISQNKPGCFGAAARAPKEDPCTNPEITDIFPGFDAAPSDRAIDPNICGEMNRGDSVPNVCKLGATSADVRIALIGDSHAGHYLGAITDLANLQQWQLDFYWKPGCPFSDAVRVQDKTLTKACAEFVKAAEALIIAGNYDAVITSQVSGVKWVNSGSLDQRESAIDGLVSLWSRLESAGVQVIAIKDNPVPRADFINCYQNGGSIRDCSVARSSAFAFDAQVEAVRRLNSANVTLIDFDNVFCEPNFCPPIIGNVIVYRGDSHLTNTFAKTLAPYILPALNAAVMR